MKTAILWLALAVAPLAWAQTPQEQALALLNAERWDNGQLPPLKGQANLDSAADGHSQAMGVRNFFSHCDPDTGTLPWDRMTDAGYAWNYAGENIAAGYGSAAGVVAGWMSSPSHRQQILSTQAREVGTGYYLDSGDQANVRPGTGADGCVPGPAGGGPYYHYWTQNFGRRDNVMPVVIAREAWQVSACSVDVYLYGNGWASEYRLSNDGVQWSAWRPFAADVLWWLSGTAGGTATVHAQIRNGAGAVRSAQDSVRLAVDCGDLIFASGFEAGG